MALPWTWLILIVVYWDWECGMVKLTSVIRGPLHGIEVKSHCCKFAKKKNLTSELILIFCKLNVAMKVIKIHHVLFLYIKCIEHHVLMTMSVRRDSCNSPHSDKIRTSRTYFSEILWLFLQRCSVHVLIFHSCLGCLVLFIEPLDPVASIQSL